MREYGTDLTTYRQKRTPLGFKADRIHRTQPINTGTEVPGGQLVVKLPKIAGEVIAPGSMYVSFKATPVSSTDKAATFVKNLGRAIQMRKEVKFNGRPATETNGYGEFKLYSDLWLPEHDRKERVMQGIQDENALKHRVGAKKDAAGAALTGVSDGEKALALAYSNIFYIPLDDELFNDIAPFAPFYLQNLCTVEIALAEAKDVVLSSDKGASYKLSNIQLEWDAIQDASLASEVASMYSAGLGVHYDRVQLLRTEHFSKKQSLINVPIKESLASLRGVMILFKEEDDEAKYACKREKFYNPHMENIDVTVGSKSNMLYTNGMKPKDLWHEVKKYFQGTTRMTQGEFFSNSFCLWIDLRSSTDNALHGNGLRMDPDVTGLNLAIKRTTSDAGNVVMRIFLVIDAFLEFENSQFKRNAYALVSNPTVGDGDM